MASISLQARNDANVTIAVTSTSSLRLILSNFCELYLSNGNLSLWGSHDWMRNVLQDHDLPSNNPVSLQSRQHLFVHVFNGMCTWHHGRVCSSLHEYSTPDVQRTFASLICDYFDAGRISQFAVRELALSIGIRFGEDLNLSVLRASFQERNRVLDSVCSLNFFLHSLNNLNRRDLVTLACSHGILPSSALTTIRSDLLIHLLSASCYKQTAINVYACSAIKKSTPGVIEDSDPTAAILCLIYLNPSIPLTNLRLILSSLIGTDVCNQTRAALQTLLKTHILRLRRGPSVFSTLSLHFAIFSDPERLARAHANWPECATHDLKESIRASFDRELSRDKLRLSVCASCDAFISSVDRVSASETDFDWNVLHPPTDYTDLDILKCAGIDVSTGPLFSAMAFSRDCSRSHFFLCHSCHKSIQSDIIPQFSLANHMLLGDVPMELQDLTFVEESMIALTRLKCMIVQLKEESKNYSSVAPQRAYRGHTIYYHQNVGAAYSCLPPSVEEIVKYVCVLFVGAHMPSQEYLLSHAKPIAVRAHKVRRALLWLKKNNPLYNDIAVNHVVLDEIERLEHLPYTVYHLESVTGNDDTLSGYANPLSEKPNCDESDNILFDNVVITDLSGSPSSTEMRDAALRHLLSGKPFVQVGHTGSPEKDFYNPNLFPELFPTLYPYGVGGFEDPRRSRPVAFKQHLKHLLNLSDRRFQVHPSFLFTAFNILQRREVLRRTAMRVKRSDFREKAALYVNIKPDTINRVGSMINEKSFNFEPKSDEHAVVRLMQDVQLVNSTVLGSNFARSAMREQIRSLIISFGAPSLYITINPADVYNPIVRVMTDTDIANDETNAYFSFLEQAKLIAHNPVVAAQFFHTLMTFFFQHILRFRSGTKKEIGLFGHTKAYYGCVEAQGRGTLHCHGLIWLEGSLNPSQIKQRLLSANQSRFKHNLIQYLEDNIRTAIPFDPGDVDDVPSTMHHPSSCYPVRRMPTENAERFQRRRQKDLFNLIRQCQQHIHTATCYKYCSPQGEKICRFGLGTNTVNQHTSVDKETGELNYQRLDGFVNQYNETIIEILRCNMDLKFIGSGQSAKAILYYITDYISKSQLKMHVVYNALELAIKKMQTTDALQCISSELTTEDAGRAILRKTANSIIALQELSAQQVALLSLQEADHYTSHKFSYCYWSYAEQFVDSVLPLTSNSDDQFRANAADDDHENRLDETLTTESDTANDDFGEKMLIDPDDNVEQPFVHLSPSDGLKMKSSQLADYIYRPAFLQSLSFWEYIAHCTKLKQRRKKENTPPSSNSDEDSDNNDTNDQNKEPLLADNAHTTTTSDKTTFEIITSASKQKGYLHFLPQHNDARSHGVKVWNFNDCFVPVLIGRGFPRRSVAESYERYCRLMLILFKPWRHPLNLKSDGLTWQTTLEQMCASNEMNFQHVKIMNNINMLHECKESRDLDFQRRFRSGSSTIPQHMPRLITCDPDNNTEGTTIEDSIDHEISEEETDAVLLHVATKVEQERNKIINNIIRKGQISGLFSLNNYSLPQSCNISDVLPSSAEHRETEASWESEYELTKRGATTAQGL